MLRKWAHVIMAALLHIGLLVACHHIAGSVFELVRDELIVDAYEVVAWAK